MARPKLKITLHETTRWEVEKRYRNTRDAREKERLLALRLACDGQHSFDDIAQELGRARSCIQRWLDRFSQGGIDALVERKKAPGKTSPLCDEKILEGLKEGLRLGRWRSAPQICAWLKTQHGINFLPKSLYYWLGKWAGALKVPRPVHIKKDTAATEAFKTQLFDKLQSLPIPSGAPVKIWVLDEARYGLHTITRRCWGLKGIPIVVPRQQKYQWGYLYGAIEVLTGQSEMLLLPTVNLDCHKIFLEQIAQSDPSAHHIIIQDQAGFHYRTQDPRQPERIHILSLPPYSPELNPTEKLWDILKDLLCNQVYPTLDHIEASITSWAQSIRQDTQAILQLVGQGWLHSQANAS